MNNQYLFLTYFIDKSTHINDHIRWYCDYNCDYYDLIVVDRHVVSTTHPDTTASHATVTAIETETVSSTTVKQHT